MLLCILVIGDAALAADFITGLIFKHQNLAIDIVLAKLLDAFALVHVPLLVRMNRQFDHPAFQQAKLEIEAGGVFFSVIPDQA